MHATQAVIEVVRLLQLLLEVVPKLCQQGVI
jgi:hypothetical protein